MTQSHFRFGKAKAEIRWNALRGRGLPFFEGLPLPVISRQASPVGFSGSNSLLGPLFLDKSWAILRVYLQRGLLAF
jgi:hypothetical protein